MLRPQPKRFFIVWGLCQNGFQFMVTPAPPGTPLRRTLDLGSREALISQSEPENKRVRVSTLRGRQTLSSGKELLGNKIRRAGPVHLFGGNPQTLAASLSAEGHPRGRAQALEEIESDSVVFQLCMRID